MEEEDDDALNDYDTARYANGASSNPNRGMGKPQPVANNFAKLDRKNFNKKLSALGNKNQVAPIGQQIVKSAAGGNKSLMSRLQFYAMVTMLMMAAMMALYFRYYNYF